ncbi:hypothetical protein [Vibrio parahaemolyticus]|uniref:hypothetical protein n=1 Tax=Vibrio parahaemolyticus TaxID=670 RepID=UPI001121A213|nr:hypothetical protein [Vibrio parahaemolyticus]TOE29483.1 hypothetical protein CGJ46_23550 [Vibrio parahaemolyticus]
MDHQSTKDRLKKGIFYKRGQRIYEQLKLHIKRIFVILAAISSIIACSEFVVRFIPVSEVPTQSAKTTKPRTKNQQEPKFLRKKQKKPLHYLVVL